MRLNFNQPALGAQRQTRRTLNILNRGLEKLATGLRIARAADDAAGLAIAERFESQVRQSAVEARNLQSGINALQTAEGSIEVQTEGVQRLRELAVQAANGTLNDEQRSALNMEAQQIIEQIETTGQNTDFNGVQLLNGTTGTIELGTEAGTSININESTAGSLGIAALDISTQAGAANALGDLDTAINSLSQNRAGIGAQQNRLERGIAVREIAGENQAAAQSAIRDLDFARQVTEQTRNQVLLQGALAGIAQGNLQSESVLRLLGG